jgi:hypothetical protein
MLRPRTEPPAGLAEAALDPPIAVALLDLQQNREHGDAGLGGELALRHVVAGLRVERVEPSRPSSRLVVVLGPADANRSPMPALEAGIRLDIVSGQLGHSNVSTTANIYAHVSDASAADAADRLGHVLEGGQ